MALFFFLARPADAPVFPNQQWGLDFLSLIIFWKEGPRWHCEPFVGSAAPVIRGAGMFPTTSERAFPDHAARNNVPAARGVTTKPINLRRIFNGRAPVPYFFSFPNVPEKKKTGNMAADDLHQLEQSKLNNSPRP